MYVLLLLGDATQALSKPDEFYALERYFGLNEPDMTHPDPVARLRARYQNAIDEMDANLLEGGLFVAIKAGIDAEKIVNEDGIWVDLTVLLEGFLAAAKDAVAGPYPVRVNPRPLFDRADKTYTRVEHKIEDGVCVVDVYLVPSTPGTALVDA